MMDTVKTPVDVIQQLLALVTARWEKQGRNGDPNKDPVISALKDELSLFGDNVNSTVDRTNPYFEGGEHNEKLFKEAVQSLKSSASELPESVEKIFQQVA